MPTLITQNETLVSQKASIRNPDITLVGIINKQGRMVESIGHGIIDLPENKKEMFFMKIALRNSMQHDFDEDLGTVNYCITERGDTKYISFPAPNGNTIFAVIKKEANHEGLVEGINQIIRYSEEFLGQNIDTDWRGKK